MATDIAPKVSPSQKRQVKGRASPQQMRGDQNISPPMQGRAPSGNVPPAMPDTTAESPMKIVRGGPSTYKGLSPAEIKRRRQVQFIKKNPTTTI